MNLSVNAKKTDFTILKQYANSLNDLYIEQKSKIYSFDFKGDSPVKSFDSDDSGKTLGNSLKVDSEVKYEWEELNGNMIGRKIRKSSDSQIKKRLQNMFAKRNRPIDSDSNSNESYLSSSPSFCLKNLNVNTNCAGNLDNWN